MDVISQIAKSSYYTNSYSSPYSSSYTASDDAAGALVGGLAIGMWIFLIIFAIFAIGAGVVTIIGQWKLYKKAGKDGYIALIPVYNVIAEMEMAGMPIYFWFLNYCSFIPWIGWIGTLAFLIWKDINLAKSFGKSAGTGVLLAFFPYIMYPVLGFGKAQYIGPKYKK